MIILVATLVAALVAVTITMTMTMTMTVAALVVAETAPRYVVGVWVLAIVENKVRQLVLL